MIEFLLVFVAIWICALTYFALRPVLRKYKIRNRWLSNYLKLVTVVVAVTIIEAIVITPLFDYFRPEDVNTTMAVAGAWVGLLSAGLYIFVTRDK